MENTEKYQEHKNNKRSILGIIFIAVGAVLIANKMDIIPSNVSHIIISWQMLLIAIGAINILTNKNLSSGLILIALGTFFILPKVFDIPFEIKEMFWPVIFVVIGILMITVKNRHKTFGKSGDSENYIDLLNLFGGGKRKITSENFLGGKVTSIFGGSELDLTTANIKDTDPVIDVFTLFGGSKIIVPTNWDVQVDVISIFGGFDDKRGPINNIDNAPIKVLKIKGMAIFGGGEVKSY